MLYAIYNLFFSESKRNMGETHKQAKTIYFSFCPIIKDKCVALACLLSNNFNLEFTCLRNNLECTCLRNN